MTTWMLQSLDTWWKVHNVKKVKTVPPFVMADTSCAASLTSPSENSVFTKSACESQFNVALRFTEITLLKARGLRQNRKTKLSDAFIIRQDKRDAQNVCAVIKGVTYKTNSWNVILLHTTLSAMTRHNLSRNPPELRVTSRQKPSTKIIYIVLQTSVRLF